MIEASDSQDDKVPPERRRADRHPSGAGVTMIRACDKMRIGVDGKLVDVSCVGLGFVTDAPPELAEQISLVVYNVIQRFEKQTRGTVRHIDRRPDGMHYVGVELFLRLTPLDVSLLKMSL